MNVKMWHERNVVVTQYFTMLCGVVYTWSPGAKRWYRVICQAGGRDSYRKAHQAGKVEWVKLTNTAGLPDSTIC